MRCHGRDAQKTTAVGGIGMDPQLRTAPPAIDGLAAQATALAAALDAGVDLGDVGISDDVAWVALDAAGLGGGFREAVMAAGGPVAVLRQGQVAAFSSPRRRRRVLPRDAIAARLRLLLPWFDIGARVVADQRRLTRFADHPACAFYGFGADVPDPRRPVVAIVGSREAGPALLERTASLARRLAKAGAVVVSGGASGIDAAAHHGAADANGDVVIISGRPIAGRVEVPIDVRHDARLCWLTPYGPWSSGVPHGRFAQRNAFIAAMADVTIAVCGGPRSGTRHTVDAALLFRRPVVTLAPCSSQPELASIATRLVATGAGDVVDDDITLDALLQRSVSEGAHANWVNDAQPGLPFPPGGSSSLSSSSSSSLAPDTLAHPLLRLLGARGALTIDDAAAALQSSVRELMVEVALLELDGALRRDGAVLRVSALVTSRGEG